MAILLMTERLQMSALDLSDIDAFVVYRQDPLIARYQSWDLSYDVTRARQLVASQTSGNLPIPGGWLQLAVRDRATRELQGDVAIHTSPDQPDTYDLGVTFARTNHRRGLATEALIRVLHFLFDDVGAHRVTATCDARNAPVARLLRRVGMRQESSQIEADWFKGEWTTQDGYAVLAHESNHTLSALGKQP